MTSRRWPKLVAAIGLLAALALVVWYYARPRPRTIGIPCTMTAGVDNETETYVGCNGGLCIREVDDTAYCSQECKTDDDCPEGYVCELTRSRKRRACMEEGADITPVDASVADGARLLRRRR